MTTIMTTLDDPQAFGLGQANRLRLDDWDAPASTAPLEQPASLQPMKTVLYSFQDVEDEVDREIAALALQKLKQKTCSKNHAVDYCSACGFRKPTPITKAKPFDYYSQF